MTTHALAEIPQQPFGLGVAAKSVRSSALVSGLSLAAGLCGMLSQMVQAHAFGTSLQMGAYFAVASLTGVVTGLIPVLYAGSTLPTLAKLDSFPQERSRFVSAVLAWTLLSSCAIVVLGWALSPLLVQLVMPRLEEPLLSISVGVSRLLWLTVAVNVVMSFLTTVHHARRRFLRVSGLPLLPPLSVALFVLLTSTFWGVRSIVAGLLSGGLLQLVLLLPGGIDGITLRRPQLFAPDVLQTIRLVLPVGLSLLPFSTAPFIVIFWLSRVDPAWVSYFGYSQSFAAVLSVTVGYGIAVVSFPDFAAITASGKDGALVAQVGTYLRYVFLLAAGAAIVLSVFRVPLLELLLERGAFNDASVRGTASILPWYAAASVCLACLNLLRTTYYAKGEYSAAATMGLLVPVALLAMAGILGRSFSHMGVAVAYTFSNALHLVLALVWMRNGSVRLFSWPLLAYMARVLIVLGISAFVAALLQGFLGSAVPLWAAVGTGALVTSVLAVTLACTLMPITEVRRLSAFLVARFVR